MRSIEGGVPKLIAEGNLLVAQWYPSGDSLLIMSPIPNDFDSHQDITKQSAENSYFIKRLFLDGKIEDLGIEAEAVRISPDGSWLMVSTVENTTIQSVDSQDMTLLHGHGGMSELQAVAWSPDSTHIATITSSLVNDKLQVLLQIMTVDGASQNRLLTSPTLQQQTGAAGLVWVEPDRLMYLQRSDDDKKTILFSIDDVRKKQI